MVFKGTDFQQFLFLASVVVLEELIFYNMYFWEGVMVWK